ncbi:hypothetical protein B1A99_29290 [Cohnella sp. CIP 111063]|uniref:cell division ATP-binding protein FtsE n=1 Tax=unclassified Cohnella TaxID=2636738 RepID=UPI000B8BE486|nr:MULTISPECIES: ATP-binding cassette domain-containing protein [unclassified Cohnella]OXS53472.1 hypothetical protein B1A99_29290 [Cohnella sp. CIP 111063]PRX61487.1 cell division transport system ATP-binding protein [Cohnella sp. SGD-V74]
MIEIENLVIGYGSRKVIDGLNLVLGEGEFVYLQGGSGSGKSTLLKALYREIDRYEGCIRIDGRPLNSLPKHVTRRQLGTIFQAYELLAKKTALENVKLAGEVLGMAEAEIEARARELLETVGLLPAADRYPAELSGGEQQRTAIARALLNRPRILLADEPTGNLDSGNAARILRLLQEINRKHGVTMLVVTHSDTLVRTLPARTLVMENGKVRDHVHC